jgi:Zn-dependent M28 family amino/carboxypeptidase
MRVVFVVLVALVIFGAGAWLLVTQPIAPVAGALPSPEVDPNGLARTVRILSEDLAPRRHDPQALGPVARFITDEWRKHTLRVDEQHFTVGATPFTNVVARFGPETRERVVVGAHYDVFGTFPGADDNASGVAGLIALAAHLAEADLSMQVELVAYAPEEPPYFGSEQMGSFHHAAGLRAEGAEVRLAVILEMIGYFDPDTGTQAYPMGFMRHLYSERADFIAIVGDLTQVGAVRAVKRSFRRGTDLRTFSINAPRWIPGIDLSDHSSYWLHGYPAVMVTDTAFYRNVAYHTRFDTWDRLDYLRMAEVVKGVHRAVLDAARQ